MAISIALHPSSHHLSCCYSSDQVENPRDPWACQVVFWWRFWLKQIHSVKRQKCFWLRLVKRCQKNHDTFSSHKLRRRATRQYSMHHASARSHVTLCPLLKPTPSSALHRFLRSVTTQKTREIEFIEIEMVALYKMLGEVPAKLKSRMDRRAETACTWLQNLPGRVEIQKLFDHICMAFWWNMPVPQSSGMLFYNLIAELWRRLLYNILGPKVCETLFGDMERFGCQKVVEACCQKVTSCSTFAKIKRLLKESRITRPCTQDSGRTRVLKSLPHSFQTPNLYWFKIVVTVSSHLDLDKARSRSSVQHTWTFCYTVRTTLHDRHLDAWDVSHLEMCGKGHVMKYIRVEARPHARKDELYIRHIYIYVFMYSCIYTKNQVIHQETSKPTNIHHSLTTRPISPNPLPLRQHFRGRFLLSDAVLSNGWGRKVSLRDCMTAWPLFVVLQSAGMDNHATHSPRHVGV